MLYSIHKPKPPLSEFVDYLWHVEKGGESRKALILPSGTVELVVLLGEDQGLIHNPARPDQSQRFSRATISGTYSGPLTIAGDRRDAIFGVRFKPGGAYSFLGVSASALANTHTDLRDLWGQQAAELRERLCCAAMPQERFQIAEACLMDRLRRGVTGHAAVTAALGLFGQEVKGITVRSAAERLGFSQRHFINLFTTQVGLPPKLFCRLLRFQRALRLAQGTGATRLERGCPGRGVHEKSWADVALECGYFDQSHLIRDFQEFAGVAPALFCRDLSVDLIENHLVLSA